MAKEDCAAAADTSHGDIYSEDEADDFKRPNPHVTRPEDLRHLRFPWHCGHLHSSPLSTVMSVIP